MDKRDELLKEIKNHAPYYVYKDNHIICAVCGSSVNYFLESPEEGDRWDWAMAWIYNPANHSDRCAWAQVVRYLRQQREPDRVYLWGMEPRALSNTYPMVCVDRDGHSRYRYNLTRASCKRLFAWAQGERKEPVTDPGHTRVRWDGWTWAKE